MALLHCDFFSDVLQLSCSMDVILPQAPARRRFPTLYLLHGLSDDHTIWQRRTSIERHVADLPLAVVMPAVGRSFYTDMARGLRYWTFISEELPALCRRLFPLSARRDDTFVAGLSMGGYGAFKLALRCPRRYAAAASLSGALDMATLLENDPSRGPEMANIFGDLTRFRGSANDLLHLAEALARSAGPKPRLFQWCGTEDFLYPGNLAFRDHARRLGLDLTYTDGPGDHQWKHWDDQIQHVLRWLPLQR
ncbi:MAG TPA: alpha/beta hydrolase family protein [Planctomycetota bacterium]|nr:alpha/beta hydrolase family protein [Planctomycetota bacterium]